MIMNTHQRGHILALSRYWVVVPLALKFSAVMLDFVKEQCVQQPEVVWVVSVKKVKPFQACEKCSPAPGKMASTLKPQPLNSGVMR
jgi:hypothetical protein